MDEFLRLLLLFGVGMIAGFINIMAGGGSTLTLPALIFMGLEGSIANGTNRVAILIQNIFAVISFHQEKYHKFRFSLKLATFTLPGAIVGAVIATKISNELFQRILAYVLIGVIVAILFRKSNQTENLEKNRHQNSWLIYPAMFVVGFYGGFIQVGVGFLLMASLFYLLKINLIRVNMHKVFIIFIYTIPALLVFSLTHNVNWKYGLALAAGNSLGGWWSVKVSVKKGEGIIRIVLIAAILIMAMKLLNIF
jgi:uncharacterized membrane protein YfcA